MRRFVVTPLLIVLWLGATAAAAASDLSPSAFYGNYLGSGVAESGDSIYFNITVRDLGVTIEPDGRGFKVSWTTVLRQGGEPGKPKIRRKSRTVTFMKTDRPNVFVGESSGDPLDGEEMVWARISENSMTVYVLSIDAAGVYEVQSYKRTLSGAGMDLSFVRVRDGEPVRSVAGKLIKLSVDKTIK